MDKKQELIQQCRYYKGEEKNPYNHDSRYRVVWLCEKEWVDLEMAGTIEKLSPFGYSTIWSQNIEPPRVEGYDTPLNLLRTLLCYFAYFNACHPEEISTKMLVTRENGEWVERTLMEGFGLFLLRDYYKSSASTTV